MLYVMQGNCEAPAPDVELPTSHAPLRPFLPLQCLLLASDNLFQANGTRLWIDRLYIRLTTARHDLFTQLVEARAGRLWMTEMTLQGNGDGVRDCWACGIYSWEGATVYVAGAFLRQCILRLLYVAACPDLFSFGMIFPPCH